MGKGCSCSTGTGTGTGCEGPRFISFVSVSNFLSGFDAMFVVIAQHIAAVEGLAMSRVIASPSPLSLSLLLLQKQSGQVLAIPFEHSRRQL